MKKQSFWLLCLSLVFAVTFPALAARGKCNYQHSSNACENSYLGASCDNNGKPGMCYSKGTTGDTFDCTCRTPSAFFGPSTLGPKCNYTHSDNSCEHSYPGLPCLASGGLGVCVQKDSTNNTADCRCLKVGKQFRFLASSTQKCNYTHSDSSCERLYPGAPCLSGSKTGICVQKDTTGTEADCRCVAQ